MSKVGMSATLHCLSQPKAHSSPSTFSCPTLTERYPHRHCTSLSAPSHTAAAVCAQLKRTDCFSISSLFSWLLWKPKNQILQRISAH